MTKYQNQQIRFGIEKDQFIIIFGKDYLYLSLEDATFLLKGLFDFVVKS
jgi:hypothetical protein